MNFLRVRKVILSVLSAVLLFVSGYSLGVYGIDLDSLTRGKINRSLPANRLNVNFDLFWKVWDTLESNYYDKSKLVVGDMIYGAISGMVGAVGDPYTSFLTPDQNKIVEEDLSGSFEGVGIQIGFKGKNLAVIAPLPDSPAEKAGIKAGDFIIGIKDDTKGVDTVTTGININDAVKLIRGKAGTKVTLFLTRDGISETLIKEVTRQALDVPSVVLDFVGQDENIAHIKLLKFGADTKKEWEKAVEKINDKKPNAKLILDLRNNPGGYLQGAVDIAGYFVKKDSVIVIEDRSGQKTEFKTDISPKLDKYKLVILVNEGSASASEILAGALSEIKGIKLIGEKTFGKGTIQEPLQLEKGAGLHITTAKWLTPKGNWVHEAGLKPDIEIKDNEETTEDEQLQEAIRQVI